MRNLFRPIAGKKKEEGAMALILVVVASLVIITTLSTVYVYLVNRAKYQARIREAYKMTHVMEEFGKVMRQASDRALAASINTGGVDCGLGGPQSMALDETTTLCFSPCPAAPPAGVVMPSNYGQAGGACEGGTADTSGFMCVTHLGQAYCLAPGAQQVAGGAGGTGMVAQIPSFNLDIKDDVRGDARFLSWYRRLDRFFDSTERPVQMAAAGVSEALQLPSPTIFGWLIREANAAAVGMDIGVICDYSPGMDQCQNQGDVIIDPVVRDYPVGGDYPGGGGPYVRDYPGGGQTGRCIYPMVLVDGVCQHPNPGDTGGGQVGGGPGPVQDPGGPPPGPTEPPTGEEQVVASLICGLDPQQISPEMCAGQGRTGVCACLCDAGAIQSPETCGPQVQMTSTDCAGGPGSASCQVCDSNGTAANGELGCVRLMVCNELIGGAGCANSYGQFNTVIKLTQ